MRNSFTSTQWSPRILGHRIRKDFKHFQWISLEARLMHSAQLRENSALSLSLPLSHSQSLLVVLLSVYLAKETFVYIFDEAVKAKMQQPAKVSGKTLQENIAHTQEKEQRKSKRKKRETERERESTKQSESQWEWEHKCWNMKCLKFLCQNVCWRKLKMVKKKKNK